MQPNMISSYISLTDQEFSNIVSFVYQTYGIDLRKKRQLIEGRLSFLLKNKGLSSYTDYLNLILEDKTQKELHTFLNKITTNHSYFARETDHFDFLTQTILPKLEKTRNHDLRIWSAGCSSGQEAFNIAMAIDQYFGCRKQNWDTTILATDISTDALSKAKQGIYSAENVMGLPAHWKKLYFKELEDGTYQICDKIKNEVVFRVANLMDPFVYKKPFDIIFCRNVMIYFDQNTTTKLVNKFYEATSVGGYLLIGHSESIDRKNVAYTYLQPSIYQKTKKGGGT